jgi:hypothetical protein
MKRSSSSTKENNGKCQTHKLSTRKRHFEHHPSLLSNTQTFFPSQNGT